ncbi:MAG: DUF6149 family protein [Halobacteriaceae archaeon]
MKIRQNVRHFASRKALETPVVGGYVHDWLVDLHTGVFLDRAPESRRAERRPRLDALFDATVDMYLAALQAGRSEAAAREITHVVANFDFYNHGWTEMMEFPADEVEAHYERHREFFDAHGVTVADPLGEFAPPGGLPDAAPTLEKLDDPEHPHAEGGFADDVYVEDETGAVSAGSNPEPEDVDPTDAPGVPARDDT